LTTKREQSSQGERKSGIAKPEMQCTCSKRKVKEAKVQRQMADMQYTHGDEITLVQALESQGSKVLKVAQH
jgi:hypothetical protein